VFTASDGGDEAPFRYEAPVDWWKLDAGERAETLQALAEFTAQLARMYGLRESILPPCWYLHPAIIQELLALLQYRNQQQYLPVSPPGAAIDFHIQLAACLSRVRSWVLQTQCNQREHNSSEYSLWAVAGSDVALLWQEQFDAHIAHQEPSVNVSGAGEDIHHAALLFEGK
jgi:hypothetical protein